jgi:multiple antibiotic resistance protein
MAEVIFLTFFIVALTSLFVIINPFSTASVFLTITRGDSHAKKLLMARKAAITASIVLIVFTFIGVFILKFFSITVDAFRIAGGLLIGGVGWRMIKAKREHLPSKKEKDDAIDKDDISIVPLAIPMMSGPGAIATVILLSSESSGIIDLLAIVLASLLICLLSFFVLARADIFDKFFGDTGRRVLDRIMGLIVLVVGVQFIINGLSGAFGF